MKNDMSILVIAVVAAAAVAGGLYLRRRLLFPMTPMQEDIEVRAARALMDQEAPSGRLVVLDVRTPKEYAEARLEGGVNLDFFAGDFREKVAALARDKTYLVHCAVGGRSAKAVALMKGLGFPRAYNLKGGIQAWRAAGLPVAR